MRTLGYAEMADFLDRKTTLAEARDLAALHTLQFAKRQKTWFNGAGNVDRAIHWISPTTDSIDILSALATTLQSTPTSPTKTDKCVTLL